MLKCQRQHDIVAIYNSVAYFFYIYIYEGSNIQTSPVSRTFGE